MATTRLKEEEVDLLTRDEIKEHFTSAGIEYISTDSTDRMREKLRKFVRGENSKQIIDGDGAKMDPMLQLQYTSLIVATSGPAKNGHYNRRPL